MPSDVPGYRVGERSAGLLGVCIMRQAKNEKLRKSSWVRSSTEIGEFRKVRLDIAQ